ncbi:LysR family transcriptional regulator [Streptomyces sp. NPDC056149]|uniref:LysR family transcriptional regulator n=1 Tax=Streptomyces sp. NPDC056149 TaxID=3345728 RepID=UPI0035D5DDE5
MGIELHHLRGFFAVAEERHFTRAAARLHVTQPTLSRTVRVLEEKVGERLLDRTTRQVELTPAGERLFGELAELLPRLDVALGPARQRRLRLAFAWMLPDSWLHEAVVRFEEVTGTQVDMLRRDDPLTELERGEADIVMVWSRVPAARFSAVTVMEEAQVAAVGRHSAWADHEALDWFDAAELPLITNPRFGATAPQEWALKHRPSHSALVGNIDEAMAQVAAGRGIAIVPETAGRTYAHPSIQFVPVRRAPSTALSFVYPRQGGHPMVSRLVEAVLGKASSDRVA